MQTEENRYVSKKPLQIRKNDRQRTVIDSLICLEIGVQAPWTDKIADIEDGTREVFVLFRFDCSTFLE